MNSLLRAGFFAVFPLLIGTNSRCAESVPAHQPPAVTLDPSPVTEGKAAGVVSYADVVAPVQKAVVSIYSTKTVRQRVPVNPLLRDFFGGQLPERESKEEGLGSGVIVSKDGYILTNNHVVEDADELNVLLSDDREIRAHVIGADPKTDIAVIKIDGENLPTVVMADSEKLRVGDVVFAVGNPLGVGQTTTMGIVSATSRRVGILDEVQGYENFIQTDAAINQGNSGGALIDAKGRLIGINSAILSNSRGNIGIGFAVPVNLARAIMDSLVTTGTVSRGYLGVVVDQLTAETAETLGLKKESRGVIVTELTAGAPAEKGGLLRGDVILAINDHAVTSLEDLRLFVSQMPPDSEVKIRLFREGKEKLLPVKLGRQTEHSELLPGVEVVKLTDELRRGLGLMPRVEGLVVSTVDPKSPYADRLIANTVILEINRIPVNEVETARRLLAPGRNLLLMYIRGSYRYVPVAIR